MKKQYNLILSSAKEMKQLRTLTALSLLMALNIVLSETLPIRIGSQFSIGLGFLAIATAGYLFGPIPAAMIAGLCDLFKAIFFPFGPFFPGWTLSAFVGGFIYGIFFYKKDVKFVHCALAKISIAVVVNILLNSLWMSISFSSPYWIQVSQRIIKNLTMIPFEIVILYVFFQFVLKPVKKSLDNKH